MNSGIYQIRNKINGMIYVGSAVNFRFRWYGHTASLNGNRHFNKHLQAAWNKYGAEAFEFLIVEYCNKECLVKREQVWIDWTLCYDRTIGYNSRKNANSNFGIRWSEETKRLIGKASKGRKLTDEHKAKIKFARKDYKHSDETKAKIGLANKRKHSKEEIEKRSALLRGRITWPNGRVFSEETKKKMSIAHKGKKVSEITRAKSSERFKGNQINRNYNKWPCANGKKCKCESCMQKKLDYQRNWKAERKEALLNFQQGPNLLVISAQKADITKIC